ncbi:Peptidyl-tRNA hydrolase ICT1, mitochondrial [Halotydeus destructor]|nr:Peptidyl-tRNA hydrolase ICT1, mitochondrial [Halotydeus destructor]
MNISSRYVANNLACLKKHAINRVASLRHASAKSNPFLDDVPKYDSPYSLDKVYPKSKPDFTSISVKIPETKDDVFNGYIPMDKLKFSYSRSQKPGGQHVNKTNTKVRVSFHLESASWIPLEGRKKLLQLHKNDINKEGEWSIKSDKTRAQTLNLADCLDRFRCYITEACQPAPEISDETLEKRRELAEKAAATRLRQKRIHSMNKNNKRSDPLS